MNHLDTEIILLVEVPYLIETVVAGSDNNLCAGRLYYLFGFIFPVLLSNKSKPHPERNS